MRFGPFSLFSSRHCEEHRSEAIQPANFFRFPAEWIATSPPCSKEAPRNDDEERCDLSLRFALMKMFKAAPCIDGADQLGLHLGGQPDFLVGFG